MDRPAGYNEAELVNHQPKVDPILLNLSPSSTFSILHGYMGSFNHKMPLLELLLLVIAVIAECIFFLNSRFADFVILRWILNKYFIDGHNLFCNSRPTDDGGVAFMYVTTELEATVTDSCWLERRQCWFVCLTLGALLARSLRFTAPLQGHGWLTLGCACLTCHQTLLLLATWILISNQRTKMTIRHWNTW